MEGRTVDSPRCQGQTKAGQACRSFALPGRGYCFPHDPERSAEMQAARTKGQERAAKLRVLRGKRRRLEHAGQLSRFLSDLIQDVLAARVNVDLARTAIYGAAVLRQTVETAELERRLEALEAQLKPQNGRAKGWR